MSFQFSAKTFTAKQIGEHLSKAIGGEAAYIQRQVRNWQRLGLLNLVSFKGGSANAAALFTFEEMCKAAFFSTLKQIKNKVTGYRTVVGKR